MRLANQTACSLRHDYVDTAHILIGLCRNLRSHVSAVFDHFDVTKEQLLVELKRRVRRGLAPVNAGKRPVRSHAKRVTEQATQIAANLDAPSVGSVHLLLAMLAVDGTVAADVLESTGLRYDNVWTYVANPT
jgi:ATP-dependent Clp protease ATP-binding subunit ClpA